MTPPVGPTVMPPPAWTADGRDWPNRAFSRFVAAGGVRWHVQVAGSGPVILLLHGLGGATHSWRDVLPLLAQRFTVVAPDLPGHGFTSALGSPTIPAMAAAVTALLAQLDVAPELVVGHSAGAVVALRLSLTTPVPVVAINGALLPFPGIAAAIFPTMARLLFVNPLVPALAAAQARRPGVVARFLPRATGSTIDVHGVELYARLFGRRDHVAGALAMMANWDVAAVSADLPRLRAPLRLVYGERDATVPPHVSRDVAARVPGATAVAMPGGHLAHEEDPGAAAAIIARAADDWGVG